MTKSSLIHQIQTSQKVVAFTFDDGPHPVYTKQLLDIFHRVDGKATFFMIGQEIDSFEDIAVEVHNAGHEIANHTYSHVDLTRLTLEEVRVELEQGEARISRVSGKPAKHFRPPYFGINDDILSLAAEYGYHSIGAVNGEAKDWEQPGVDYILAHTRPTVENGSIFLFHDGYGDRIQTVEAVRLLVEELSDKGYRFVTVSELFELADK